MYVSNVLNIVIVLFLHATFTCFKFWYTILPLEAKWCTRIGNGTFICQHHVTGVFNQMTGVLITPELSPRTPLTQKTYVEHARHVQLLRFVRLSRTSRKQLAFGCCCKFQIIHKSYALARFNRSMETGCKYL